MEPALCSDVVKGYNPPASSGTMGLTYKGFPRSHNRKPAAASDNEIINISLTQQTKRDEMEFIRASTFQTQKSQHVPRRRDQSNGNKSDLGSRDNSVML
jgi:hypothetical protein